jgi:HEAT repeat protein
MPLSRGKKTAGIFAFLGVLVLALAAWAFRDFFIEEWWIWKLGSSDPKVVGRAGTVLASRGTARAIPGLLAPMARDSEFDSDPLFQNALRCLEKSGPRAAGPLARFLETGKPGPEMAAWAARKLIELDPQNQAAIGELIAELSGPDPAGAWEVLEEAGHDTIPDLIKLIRSRPDNRWALSRFEEIGPRASAAALALEAMVDAADFRTATAITAVIAAIGGDDKKSAPILLDGLRSGDLTLRGPAANGLAAMALRDPEIIPAIFDVLRSLPSVDDFLEEVAAWDLWKEEAAIPHLLRLLEQPGEPLRLFALDALHFSKTSDREALARLRNCLSDSDPAVVCRAAEAIIDRGDSEDFDRAAGLLISMLKNQPQPVAIIALRSFPWMGGRAEAAVPALVRLLTGPDVFLRIQAALALGRIGPPARAAVPELITVLDGTLAITRPAAARALLGIGPDARPAVDRLNESLKDRDEVVRIWASAALIALDPAASAIHIRSIIAVLDQETRNFNALNAAVTAIIELGPSARGTAAALIRAAERTAVNHEGVQFSTALRALGPTPEEIRAFASRLADPVKITRRVAALLLSDLGPDLRPVLPELLAALESRDPQVREHSIQALGGIEDPPAEVAEALRKALDDRASAVRHQARLALFKRRTAR